MKEEAEKQTGIPFGPNMVEAFGDATQTFINMGLLEQLLSPEIMTKTTGKRWAYHQTTTHINFGFFYLDGKWYGRIIDKQWKNPRGSNNVAKGLTLPECVHNTVQYFKSVRNSYGKRG